MMPSKPPLEILWDSDDAVAIATPAALATIPGREGPDSVLHTLGAQIGLPASGTVDLRLRVLDNVLVFDAALLVARVG